MEKPLPSIRNNLSFVPLRIRLMVGESRIPGGGATGFLWNVGHNSFLVTNWHVVTGRHADTGKPLDTKTSGLPHTLSISIPLQRHEEERPVSHIWWSEAEMPLYRDPDRKEPCWFEHPTYGSKADVVALPFDLSHPHFAAIAANDKAALKLNTPAVYPTLSVFVVGYPLGLTGGMQLPIYKRATIANEAEFPIDDLPKFFVDTATRKGMSGAPVFFDQIGSWLDQREAGDGDPVLSVGGRGRRFIGIYAARDGRSTEMEAQLGIVWKPEVIDEVIAGRKIGKSSFWLS